MKDYLKKLIALLLVSCCLLSLLACDKKVCEHIYEGVVTTEATCQTSGVKTYTCSLCGDSYTESIPETQHRYQSEIVKAATCTTAGQRKYTCSICGDSYTESIEICEHKVGIDNYCSICGKLVLCTTETEKDNSSKVYWISDRQIWHQDDNKRFVLVFALKDESENYLSAPAVVEIKIVNDSGVTVYTDTRIVKSSDFATWSYNGGATKKYQGTIYINDDDISHGKTSKGTIYFKVYSKGYFSFNESTLSIVGSLPSCEYCHGEGEVIKEATCINKGEVRYTCTVCGTTYTESTEYANHKVGSDNYCSVCGKVVLCTTEAEKSNSSKVHYIGDRQIWYDDTNNRYVLVFALKDSDHNYLAAPAVVEIKIVNDSGTTVYADTKIVKSSDFKNWYYDNGTTKKYQGTIYINDSDIPKDKGIGKKICFTVHSDGYFNFSESTLTMPTRIIIPTFPKTINYHSYVSVKITNITYKINSSSVYLYFAGEKTYDSRGNNYSRDCGIGWKLYDSEGYLIDSGTYYTDSLKVGDKFKDGEWRIRKTLNAGEIYTLELLNVG